MNEQKKFLIIGISGTTNSGKTTLVSKLNKLFPQAQTMGQDHYFLAPDDKRLEQYYVPEVDHCNWEQFGALEMDRMIEDVEKWKEQHICYDSDPVPVLIIEGFLIFNHRHRSYNPPDKPGYFEKVVWPMYLINKKEIEAQTDIVYIDGTEDQEKVVQQITEDIEQLMVSHHS
ncbi:nicotinamide riboside kinase 1-like isoform X2 [Babylonia areolata]|uniref:nicotinamide riboside kinase 1-like isoform X2 n=1 Tax=Babylonia areolata TaxID=304850 RepID=UPI003FD691D7